MFKNEFFDSHIFVYRICFYQSGIVSLNPFTFFNMKNDFRIKLDGFLRGAGS